MEKRQGSAEKQGQRAAGSVPADKAQESTLKGSMPPPQLGATLSANPETTTTAKKMTKKKVVSHQKSSSSAAAAGKDGATGKSVSSGKKEKNAVGGGGSAGAEKPVSLKKSRSQSAASSHSKMPMQSSSSPPKLHHAASVQVQPFDSQRPVEAKAPGAGSTGGATTVKKTVVSRKIKIGSSTKKKLGASGSTDGKPGERKIRTTIIKKVIRKKKSVKSSGQGSESIASSKIAKQQSNLSASSQKAGYSKSSSAVKLAGAASISAAKALKLKSQRSQESTGKPQRPPILLSEAEEQFRWILKPFATADDQKTWHSRFTNLLAQRQQKQSDSEKKEPPCMACYTRLPDLVKEVITLEADQDNIDMDMVAPNRLTPTDASWLTMMAFCKRCCHNKQQLTGAHLSCLGMKSRGFQLLELTPQLAQGTKKRILLFECDLCGFARSQKGVSGGDSAVRKLATCLICRRRNWSNQDNPGSLLRKLTPQLPVPATVADPPTLITTVDAGVAAESADQVQPVGVHAICAALFGKQRGLRLLDATQMLFGLDQARMEELLAQSEERKDQPPKCDICKVTIKRAGTITVKCSGVEIVEDKQEQSEDGVALKPAGDNEDDIMREEEDNSKEAQKVVKLKTVQCTKHVHSSCLMERSKWRSCIIGSTVRGFCRTHEPQYKLAMPVKNVALMQLLKADRDAFLTSQQAVNGSQPELQVSVDGSHFMTKIQELLYEQIDESALLDPHDEAQQEMQPLMYCENLMKSNPRSALLLQNSSLIKKPSCQSETNTTTPLQLAALSVFEQCLVAKLWFSQARHALRAPASEQLLASHIEQAEHNLLFNFEDMVQTLAEKKSLHVAEADEHILALLAQAKPKEIYEVVRADGDEEVEPGNEKLVINQESIESNEAIHGQINQYLSESLQRCSLLKGHLLELYVRGNEHYALQRGQAMLNSPDKTLIFEEVGQVLEFLEELRLQDFVIYSKLYELYQVQKQWRAKITRMLSTPAPSMQEMTIEMRAFRLRERGIALVQTRLNELKRLLSEKPPVEHFVALLNEDMDQTVFNNMHYIERLTRKHLWITEFDNMPQTLQQLQCQPRPVKNLYQTLLLLACQPLRANQYEQLLQVWQHSCLWQAHAKSFIALHGDTTVATQDGACDPTPQQQMAVDWDNDSSHDPMDVDQAIEMDNQLLRELRDHQEAVVLPRITTQLGKFIEQSRAAQLDHQEDYAVDNVDGFEEEQAVPVARKTQKPTRMFFTDENIDELLSQPCSDPADYSQVKFVYDKALCEKVWHRASYLRKLKAKLPHVALECHQIDEINEYIRECEVQTNFDLTHEAAVAKEKLCLMQDALKIGQINNQEDQGLVASEVYSRVQQLQEREVDKIRIPDDLEMMLSAKVQISEKLRRDFYDILEKGKGADSFNKEQMQNLRNIVQKATKDHGLQMEQENKIVDNLKNSEAWLDSTFRSLRSTCGPALNQIDFKDFQQLHSIFQSAKDCEMLLKRHVHSKMDSLVGAAKNLYMSLLRAKWLFDVKNLMDKATGTKDLAQLLCLYNRAKELEIDFGKTQSKTVQESDASAIYNLAKQRLHDQQQTQETLILREFSRLGEVSSEFDQLFGTHLKIISTLEKHEKEETMENLKKTVEKLQADLQQTPMSPTNETSPPDLQQLPAQSNSILPPTSAAVATQAAVSQVVKRELQFGSRVFAISTANELEILAKVRDYIRLNENYNEYMLLKSSSSPVTGSNQAVKPSYADVSIQQVDEAVVNKVTNETEVVVAEDGNVTARKPTEKVPAASATSVQIDTTDQKQDYVDKPDKDQTQTATVAPQKQKISYQKAMELQRQAREQQIPDDIPVLKRLNQSVQRFEKFRRLCTDYYRFREKIKQKGAELLTSNSALIGQKQQDRPKLLAQSTTSSLQQNNSDTKFSLAFLKRLLLESEEIDIEIPKEHFNKDKIQEELTFFSQWKLKTEHTLKLLEKELSHSSATRKPENLTDVVSEATRKLFEEAKLQIKELPVFDNETFMRIQAFEWLLMATSLIQGQPYKSQSQAAAATANSSTFAPSQQHAQPIAEKPAQVSVQSQRIYSLTFWEQLFRQHENYLKVLPMLEDHPIIQNILWEMDRAKSIVEFVKTTKKKIQSNQGKFLSDRYYNYVAFKDKQDPGKIRKLLEQAQSTRVNINEETQALKEWIRTYERYTQMDESGTLYTGNNYEKIKQIYKNIYLSPLDFGELYFEIGKRLEIANEIRQDIKLILEENQIENSKKLSQKRQRISLSRLQTDLNHFKMNCQIPGIFEIDRVIKQIQTSRKTIKECKEIILSAMAPDKSVPEQIEALEQARKVQNMIEIDMEDEETEIRKLMFQKNFGLILDNHVKINVEQFKAMQEEFRQDLRQELDSEIAKEFKEFREQVNLCIKFIQKCPTKDLLDNEVKEKIEELCPQVDFEQMFLDRAAQLYHMAQKKTGPFGGIGNLETSIQDADDDEDASEEGEAEMSEDQSESYSRGSLVSKSGRDSRVVSSSSDSSDSDSSSSSGSSSSSDDSSSDDNGKNASNESSSSGESEAVLKPTKKQSAGDASAKKKNKAEVRNQEDKQRESESSESEQEENAQSSSKDERASEPSAAAESNQEGIATRRAKRNAKANKMDDHIYYNSKTGKKRTGAEAGVSAGSKENNAGQLQSGKKRRQQPSSSGDEAARDDDHDKKIEGGNDADGSDEESSKSGEAGDAGPREAKKERKRQLKQERKEARQAEKCFNRQKAKQVEMRERRKQEDMSPMDVDIAFNVSQDQELQSRLKQTQDRIRNNSRNQIYSALAKFDRQLFTSGKDVAEDLEQEELDLQYSLGVKSVMQQLEGHVFAKNSQVGAQYQSKVSDILANLNLLLSDKFKDLAELFFVRKTFNVLKLYTSCVVFSEFIEKVNQQRIERRQRHQQLRKHQQPPTSGSNLNVSMRANQDMAGGNQDDVTIPSHQKLLPLAYPKNPERVNRDLSKHAFPDTKQEQSSKDPIVVGGQSATVGGASSPEEPHAKRATLTRHDSQASIDSLESVPAKFSDDGEEEIDPFKQAASGLIMGSIQSGQQTKRRHRPSVSASKVFQNQNRNPRDYLGSESNGMGIGGGSVIMPVPCIMQIPQFKYNPYNIVHATKQQKQMKNSLFGDSSMFDLGMPMPPNLLGPPSKPDNILYNPLKSTSLGADGKGPAMKIRNAAAPGSLIKVWEGTLDLGNSNTSSQSQDKHETIECQLFSVGDIRHYQSLPEFPTKLTLKGKSRIGEVMSHFRKVRQEMQNQKHSGHSSSNMLLKGWITRKNLTSQDNSDRYTGHYDKLEQIQRCSVFTLFEGVSVYLVPITSQTKDFCRQMGIYPLKGKDQQPENGPSKDLNNPEESSLVDETHYYAFLSQVRQSFSKRSSYQNPEVICHAHEMPKVPAPPQSATTVKPVQPASEATGLKNEKLDWGGDVVVSNPSQFNRASVSDPRQQPGGSASSPLNLIQPAPQPVIKREMVGYNQVPVYAGDEQETIYVDEDDARIDALIEKFRAQEDPNIDEIQRELKPLLDSQESVRREEKLVNFLKETIAKVQSRQQRQNTEMMHEQSGAAMMQPQLHQSHPYSHQQQQQHMGYDSGLMPPHMQGNFQSDMQQMPFGGDNSNGYQQHRYDQPHPYGMQAGPPANYHHPQMMHGSRPLNQHAQHMQQQPQMDSQMSGMPPGMMSMGTNMGHGGPPMPFMRLPPTSFPQQPPEYPMHPQSQQHGQKYGYPLAPPGQPRPPQGGVNQNDQHYNGQM